MARILVIDDDHLMRTIIFRYRIRPGHDVLTASDGLEGVEASRSCPDLVDIVLIDIVHAACDGQRSSDSHSTKQAAGGRDLHDGHARASERGKCTGSGKPVRLERLQGAICQILKGSTRSTQ